MSQARDWMDQALERWGHDRERIGGQPWEVSLVCMDLAYWSCPTRPLPSAAELARTWGWHTVHVQLVLAELPQEHRLHRAARLGAT